MALQFEASVWHATCDRLATSHQKGCGLSFELYQRSFSASIDGLVEDLAEDDRSQALNIAREFAYETREVLDAEAATWDKDTCAHELDKRSCPVGCGDVE